MFPVLVRAISRLLPAAEATARFPDVQLNRAVRAWRSTRLKDLAVNGTQNRALAYCEAPDQTTVPNALLARCPPDDVGVWTNGEVPAASRQGRWHLSDLRSTSSSLFVRYRPEVTARPVRNGPATAGNESRPNVRGTLLAAGRLKPISQHARRAASHAPSDISRRIPLQTLRFSRRRRQPWSVDWRFAITASGISCWASPVPRNPDGSARIKRDKRWSGHRQTGSARGSLSPRDRMSLKQGHLSPLALFGPRSMCE